MAKLRGWVVGIGWALLLLVALAYVWKYGSNVPYWDDWILVPALTAEEGPPLGYFWEQNNEHRLALSRLLLVAWISLAGMDFRAPLFVQVAILGALALGLVRLMARLRGHARLTDLVIPVLLLNLGHHDNFLWTWQLQHVLVMALVGALLVLILASGRRMTWPTVLLTGLLLVALPGCGAPALAYVPCGLLWLAWAGWSAIGTRDPGSVPRAGLAFACVAAGLAAAAAYLYDLQTYEEPPAVGPGQVASAVLRFLSQAFGPAGLSLSVVEFSFSLDPYLGVGVAALLLSSAAVLLRAVRKRPMAEAARTLGLLFFLGSVGLVALGVGVRRPYSADVGYYAIYVAPAVLAGYAACELYGGAVLRPIVSFGVCLTGLALLGPNALKAVEEGQARRARMEAFEADLAKWLPLYVLLARHTPTIWPVTTEEETISTYVLLLRDAEIGDYARIEENPRFLRIPLPLSPARVEGGEWQAQTFRNAEAGAYLDFQLPQKTEVAGLELEGVYLQGGIPFVAADWPTPEQPEMGGGHRFEFVPASTHCTAALGKPIRIWVGEEIDQFRLFPHVHGPFEVRLERITLLVPVRRKPSERGPPR